MSDQVDEHLDAAFACLDDVSARELHATALALERRRDGFGEVFEHLPQRRRCPRGRLGHGSSPPSPSGVRLPGRREARRADSGCSGALLAACARASPHANVKPGSEGLTSNPSLPACAGLGGRPRGPAFSKDGGRRGSTMEGHNFRLPALLGAIALVALAASISLVAAAGPAYGAHTLAVSQTRIDGFAQDGRFIAWSAGTMNGFPCGRRVTIRNLATGRQRTFTSRFTPCFFSLALGGKHALATTPPTICGNCYGTTIWTASLGGHLAELETFAQAPDGGGHQLTGIAGDRRVLALSWVGYRLVNEDCNPACMWEVTGGRVNRVVDDRNQVRVPGVAPAAVLAVGAGRVATAPAVASWQGDDTSTRPDEDGPVNVVDADTGSPVVTVSPTGTVQDLALSSDSLAVLVESADGTHAIERYAIPAGTLMSSTSVSGQARDLDVVGKWWIVYRVWRRIKLIDQVGARHLLLVAPHRPIDVSIEGGRVAWAENGGGRHRVRAAFTPAP